MRNRPCGCHVHEHDILAGCADTKIALSTLHVILISLLPVPDGMCECRSLEIAPATAFRSERDKCLQIKFWHECRGLSCCMRVNHSHKV